MNDFIIKKETSHMGVLIIKEIDYALAKDIIVKNHYSHKWNTSFGKINIGIFREDMINGCLGVASFGNLMNPKSYINFNKNFTQENVVELNRLWIDDELGMNAETILLGASWKIIRNSYPSVKAVQSFADGRLGCGTIYKASNFDYYGYTKTLFYKNKQTGDFQHKVPMENTKRPDGMIKLNYQYVLGILEPYYVKTYKYIYPLYKNVKIDLKKEEYPKYDKGMELVKEYKHNDGLIFRSFILSNLLNYNTEFEEIKKYILKTYDNEKIKNNLNNAMHNESIIQIAKERKIYDKYLNILKLNLNDIVLVNATKNKNMTIFDF